MPQAASSNPTATTSQAPAGLFLSLLGTATGTTSLTGASTSTASSTLASAANTQDAIANTATRTSTGSTRTYLYKDASSGLAAAGKSLSSNQSKTAAAASTLDTTANTPSSELPVTPEISLPASANLPLVLPFNLNEIGQPTSSLLVECDQDASASTPAAEVAAATTATATSASDITSQLAAATANDLASGSNAILSNRAMLNGMSAAVTTLNAGTSKSAAVSDDQDSATATDASTPAPVLMSALAQAMTQGAPAQNSLAMPHSIGDDDATATAATTSQATSNAAQTAAPLAATKFDMTAAQAHTNAAADTAVDATATAPQAKSNTATHKIELTGQQAYEGAPVTSAQSTSCRDVTVQRVSNSSAPLSQTTQPASSTISTDNHDLSSQVTLSAAASESNSAAVIPANRNTASLPAEAQPVAASDDASQAIPVELTATQAAAIDVAATATAPDSSSTQPQTTTSDAPSTTVKPIAKGGPVKSTLSVQAAETSSGRASSASAATAGLSSGMTQRVSNLAKGDQTQRSANATDTAAAHKAAASDTTAAQRTTSAQSDTDLSGLTTKIDTAVKDVASASQHVAAPVAAANATVATTATDTSDGLSVQQAVAAATRHADSAADPQATAAMTSLNNLQAARLVQQAATSELQMGIQAGEFGKIDIHTTLGLNQMSARIYVEHSELGKTMAEALPQLHEKLAVEHRVDAQIQLYNTGTGNNYGTDRQQQQQQNASKQSFNEYPEADETPAAVVAQESVYTASSSGLDMLA